MSDEIIQAYIKYSNIGWTKSFDFNTIQHYKVMVGKFYELGFGTNKMK